MTQIYSMGLAYCSNCGISVAPPENYQCPRCHQSMRTTSHCGRERRKRALLFSEPRVA